MRLHIGQPPATPNFMPKEEGWTPLKEPSPWVLNLIATPIGIVGAMLIAMAWGQSEFRVEFGPSRFGEFAPLVYLFAVIGIGLPALIGIHELIHVLGYPSFGFTLLGNVRRAELEFNAK